MNYCLDCHERFESGVVHDCQSLKREFEKEKGNQTLEK